MRRIADPPSTSISSNCSRLIKSRQSAPLALVSRHSFSSGISSSPSAGVPKRPNPRHSTTLEWTVPLPPGHVTSPGRRPFTTGLTVQCAGSE